MRGWLLSLVLASSAQSCGGSPAPLASQRPLDLEQEPAGPAIIRAPAKAGAWYPADAGELGRAIDGYLAAPRAKLTGGGVRALIVPHAGYAFSGKTAGFSFRQIEDGAYTRVIVLGPAHDVAFHGAGLERVTAYRTPLGDVPVDVGARDALLEQPSFSEQTAAGAKEHSIEMEIPFLQRALRSPFHLLPILIGELDERSAKTVAEALRSYADEHTLIVASGDFTHYGEEYGYLPFPRDPQLAKRLEGLDLGFYEAITRLAPAGVVAYRNRTKIDSCGEGPFLVLSELLGADVRAKLLHYETSGMQNGDYSGSVGYVAAAFSGPRSPKDASLALSREEMRRLRAIATTAIEATVRGKAPIEAARYEEQAGASTRLRAPGAVFVTLEEKHELRGCVGTLNASEPLWSATAKYAVLAATKDDRFLPVSKSELGELTIEVSVLSPMTPVPGPEALRLGADGAVLELDGKRAVFLPEVAIEQGWDKATWLAELSSKAGLDREAWKRARLQAFTSQRIPLDD